LYLNILYVCDHTRSIPNPILAFQPIGFTLPFPSPLFKQTIKPNRKKNSRKLSILILGRYAGIESYFGKSRLDLVLEAELPLASNGRSGISLDGSSNPLVQTIIRDPAGSTSSGRLGLVERS